MPKARRRRHSPVQESVEESKSEADEAPNIGEPGDVGEPGILDGGGDAPSTGGNDTDQAVNEDGNSSKGGDSHPSPTFVDYLQPDMEYVVANVLALNLNSPIIGALVNQNIESLHDLMCLREPDIDRLYNVDPSGGGRIPLSIGHASLLKILRRYIMAHPREIRNDSGFAWMLSKEEFCEFRCEQWESDATPIPSAPPAATTTPPASRTSLSAVELFRRGIKRDPSQFQSLKDERHHDRWHRSFENQAAAQRVGQVLDMSYTPTTSEEKELFEDMSIYLYSVLDTHVLTDKGQEIVRAHSHDRNARAVYRELLEHHRNSNKAKMNSSNILTYLTTAKLGDGNWRGTSESFIIHFLEQIRQYDSLLCSNRGQPTFSE